MLKRLMGMMVVVGMLAAFAPPALAHEATRIPSKRYMVMNAPTFPDSRQECQAFADEFRQVSKSLSDQHGECLGDAPREDHGAEECSKASCLLLHRAMLSSSKRESEENRLCSERLSSRMEEARHRKDAADRIARDDERSRAERKARDEREHAKRDRDEKEDRGDKISTVKQRKDVSTLELAKKAKDWVKNPFLEAGRAADEKMLELGLNVALPMGPAGENKTYSKSIKGVDSTREKLLGANPLAEAISGLALGGVQQVHEKALGELDRATGTIREFGTDRGLSQLGTSMPTQSTFRDTVAQQSKGAQQQCSASPSYGQCRESELPRCCYGWYEWRGKDGGLHQQCGYLSPTSNFNGDRVPGYVQCSPAKRQGATF